MSDIADAKLLNPLFEVAFREFIAQVESNSLAFAEGEAQKLKAIAKNAITSLESADPARRKDGLAQLETIRDIIKSKASDINPGNEEDNDSKIESGFKDFMKKYEDNIAGIRLGNSLAEVRLSEFTGDTNAKIQQLDTLSAPKNKEALTLESAAGRLANIVTLVDQNHDGNITREELQRFGLKTGSMSTSDAIAADDFRHAAATLRQADSDKDGAISPVEYTQARQHALNQLQPPKTPMEKKRVVSQKQ